MEPAAANAAAKYTLPDFLSMYDRVLRRRDEHEREARIKQASPTRAPPQGAISKCVGVGVGVGGCVWL